MSELKPCPFCGGVAARDIILEDGSNYGGEIIGCKRCLASTRVFFGEKEGLEESWNTRTPAPAEVEELEAGRYRMMIPVEISTTGGLLLDRKDGLHGYSLEDYPNARFFKGW